MMEPRLGLCSRLDSTTYILVGVNQTQIWEHFIYSYRIIYGIDKDKLHILAVIHGKQLIENLGDRF